MCSIREYIGGITAAAMICGIMLSFSQSSPLKPLLKLICGMILIFALVDPVINMKAGNWQALGIELKQEGKEAAEAGIRQADSTVRSLIKAETEAYIMDKAQALHLSIVPEIKLSAEALPVPVSVILKGRVSPYEKGILSKILTDELGIKKENQVWIS